MRLYQYKYDIDRTCFFFSYSVFPVEVKLIFFSDSMAAQPIQLAAAKCPTDDLTYTIVLLSIQKILIHNVLGNRTYHKLFNNEYRILKRHI